MSAHGRESYRPTGSGRVGSSRKSGQPRWLQPSRSFAVLVSEGHDSRRLSTFPMPIRDCTPHIGVLVQWTHVSVCTPRFRHVIGVLAVATRPAEGRCRSGRRGRGWERPPCFDAQCGHREGSGRTRPSHPPSGVAPGPTIPAGRLLQPVWPVQLGACLNACLRVSRASAGLAQPRFACGVWSTEGCEYDLNDLDEDGVRATDGADRFHLHRDATEREWYCGVGRQDCFANYCGVIVGYRPLTARNTQ